MRASIETYDRVAECCGAYKPVNKESVTNSACECGCDKVSCTTCGHFKNEHCDIDLYDQIVEEHGFQG